MLGLALLSTSSAFAGTKANLSINNPVTVNGTTLKPGDYKLEWNGTAGTWNSASFKARMCLPKSAHVVDLNSPSANDAAVVNNGDNGTKTLAGVRFEGKKFALELGDSSDSMQAVGSSK